MLKSSKITTNIRIQNSRNTVERISPLTIQSSHPRTWQSWSLPPNITSYLFTASNKKTFLSNEKHFLVVAAEMANGGSLTSYSVQWLLSAHRNKSKGQFDTTNILPSASRTKICTSVLNLSKTFFRLSSNSLLPAPPFWVPSRCDSFHPNF